MGTSEFHMVCTRKLEEKYHIEAQHKHLIIHDYDFLDITYLPSDELEKGIEIIKPDALVFTSQHAVESVKNLNNKNIACYTIEGKTTELAVEYGFFIKGKAKDSTALADVIKNQEEKNVVHCSSRDRMDILKTQLVKSGISYHFIEVYQKTLKPQKVGYFDGVAFYSPSQVEAFLEFNQLLPETPVFCIGKTTANAVKQKGHKKVLISEKSQTESLLETVYQYFRI